MCSDLRAEPQALPGNGIRHRGGVIRPHGSSPGRRTPGADAWVVVKAAECRHTPARLCHRPVSSHQSCQWPVNTRRAACTMSHDVFISFKNSAPDGSATPDAAIAREVYKALKRIGLKVFFSEESLAEAGRGNFSKSIETALESARILVLVASCREHIESRWVEAEWDSFLQDVRSGHKQGEMFILSCGPLNPADLPLFLRRQQMFPAASMDKLVKFVGNALPRPAALGDFIRVSLHCFHPEKDEDKVYLLTVQPGSSADTYHVTAYWGARSAKRLSSQMKAINVSAVAAKAEVAKARQEKLRSGYAPAPHARILTPEARAHLSAALGLTVTPAKAVSSRAAGAKPAVASGTTRKRAAGTTPTPKAAVAPGAAPSAKTRARRT
jgi:predicted DNA-binding WGR domain protein